MINGLYAARTTLCASSSLSSSKNRVTSKCLVHSNQLHHKLSQKKAEAHVRVVYLVANVNVHHRINLAGKVDTTERARMLMVVVSRLLHLSFCLIAVVQFKVALRRFSGVKHFKTEWTAVSTSILIFVISFIISCLVFALTVHLLLLQSL